MADWTSVSRTVPPGRDSLGDQSPRHVIRGDGNLLGFKVHLPLRIVPGRLELLDQVAR